MGGIGLGSVMNRQERASRAWLNPPRPARAIRFSVRRALLRQLLGNAALETASFVCIPGLYSRKNLSIRNIDYVGESSANYGVAGVEASAVSAFFSGSAF